jgi:hypothetical protein
MVWQPGNNGSGRRIWFVLDPERPNESRYHEKNGRMVRFETIEAAQKVADELNEQPLRRLYELAQDAVVKQYKIQTKWLVGPRIWRALVLAEVLNVIGQQDDDTNTMVRLAAYATGRAHQDAPDNV